jgi:hypothetical protein
VSFYFCLYSLSYYAVSDNYGKKLKGEFNTRECTVLDIQSTDTTEVIEYNLKGKEFVFILKRYENVRDSMISISSAISSNNDDSNSRALVLQAETEESKQWWMNHIRCRIQEAATIQKEHMLSRAREEQLQQKQIQDMSSLKAFSSTENTSLSRASISSVQASRQLSQSSITSSLVDVNRYYNTPWQQFVCNPNEYIVFTSEVVKKNKYGMSQKRQLVLTAISNVDIATSSTTNTGVRSISSTSSNAAGDMSKGFRLFYVDGGSMKVKGVIEGKGSEKPNAEMVGYTTFSLLLCYQCYLCYICYEYLQKRLVLI